MRKSGPTPRPFKGHEVTAGSSSRIYTGETYLFLLVRVTSYLYVHLILQRLGLVFNFVKEERRNHPTETFTKSGVRKYKNS